VGRECFLVFGLLGLPDDVVKRMMKVTKKMNEEFSLGQAMDYWTNNSPALVRVNHPSRFKCLKFQIWPLGALQRWESEYRKNTWQNRRNLMIEFKTQWRLRSIEERKAKVIEWCKFGNEEARDRHRNRLIQIYSSKFQDCPQYTENLWKSWEAGASSYYFVGWDRRVNISKWYEEIHTGRFFLFYKENKYIEERNNGLPKGPCEDGYKYPKTPIFNWGPYEQLAEDLRRIDGPGLGETGPKVEHIDDLFS
jgi:hypothetical protein